MEVHQQWHKGRPLFQDKHGERLSKRVVAAIAEAMAMFASNINLSEWNSDQIQKWAEHVFRVVGAQMFSRAGMELYFIQLVGRWGSRAIELYVQEAPLHNMGKASIAVQALAESQAQNQQAIQDKSRRPVSTAPETTSVSQIADFDKRVRQQVRQTLDSQSWFIHNPKSKSVHKPEAGEVGLPSECWQTSCHRWRYGMSSFIRHFHILPGYNKCATCFNSGPDLEGSEQDSMSDDSADQ